MTKLAKKGTKQKKRTYHWILHIGNSIGTKFSINMTVLNFWTKLKQKWCFRSLKKKKEKRKKKKKKKLIRFLVSHCDAAGKLTESVTKETTDKTGNIFFQFKDFIIKQYIDRSKAQFLPCFEFFDEHTISNDGLILRRDVFTRIIKRNNILESIPESSSINKTV